MRCCAASSSPMATALQGVWSHAPLLSPLTGDCSGFIELDMVNFLLWYLAWALFACCFMVTGSTICTAFGSPSSCCQRWLLVVVVMDLETVVPSFIDSTNWEASTSQCQVTSFDVCGSVVFLFPFCRSSSSFWFQLQLVFWFAFLLAVIVGGVSCSFS